MDKQNARNQYVAAFVVNLLTVGIGMSSGWSSPSIFLLTSIESPLPTGTITIHEASWIASLSSISGFLSNIFFGLITCKFGHKAPLILLAIPQIVSWSLILFAQNVYYLYAAKALIGLVGGGIGILIPLFLSEIANDRVRGTLGITFSMTAKVGILVSSVISGFCDYYTTPKIVIGVTVLFAILLWFLPESPTFLLKQNRKSDAETSIRFYRNLSGKNEDPKSLQSELDKLEIAIREGTNIDKSTRNTSRRLSWSDFKAKEARKALTIGVLLMVLRELSGCGPMLQYTANLFKEAGSKLPTHVPAMVVNGIQILGSVISMHLIDRAGRKFLYGVSTFGASLALTTLGVYMMFKSWHYDVDPFHWTPIISFGCVIFSASLAILSLPYLVVAEIMPERIKEFGQSFTMSLLWCFSFAVIKFLPFMIETLAFHGTMFVFAAVCLVGGFFVILFMPETKGKSHEEIMQSLR